MTKLQSLASVMVRPKHVRAAGLCMKGAKPWIERHGMDWRTFVRVGIPADQALATGDAFARRSVDEALKEQQ